MNGIVRWAVKHMAGINFLIVAIMIGGLALKTLKKLNGAKL
jgi:hypothetical protein